MSQNPAERVGLLARRDADAVARVDRVAVGRAAAVGDPGPGAGAHDRLQRGDEAGGGVEDPDRAVLGPIVDVGLAVGDDDDPLAAQVAVQHLPQPLRGPGRAAPGLLGRQRGDQVSNVAEQRLEAPGRGRRLVHGERRRQEPPQLSGPGPPGEPRDGAGRDRAHQPDEREGEEGEAPRGVGAPVDEAHVVDQHQQPVAAPLLVDGQHRDVDRSCRARRRRSQPLLPGGERLRGSWSQP